MSPFQCKKNDPYFKRVLKIKYSNMALVCQSSSQRKIYLKSSSGPCGRYTCESDHLFNNFAVFLHHIIENCLMNSFPQRRYQILRSSCHERYSLKPDEIVFILLYFFLEWLKLWWFHFFSPLDVCYLLIKIVSIHGI